ncbi:MAG: hypothetical protein WAP03_30290 [Methylorubrum rhodinum]|uniref:hypothetical protein n=1 Tax=Methylorubrum rhodinum TaxID=29428 RepID=UPI003BAFB701
MPLVDEGSQRSLLKPCLAVAHPGLEHPRLVPEQPWDRGEADAQAGTETITVDPPGRLTIGVDAAAAAIDLARAGRGIIYTFDNFLAPYVRSKDLEPIMPEWQVAFDGPQLYFPSRFMSAPLRAFVDFVAAERGHDARIASAGAEPMA